MGRACPTANSSTNTHSASHAGGARAEGGYLLIEVLVGALLLVLAGLGLYVGLDSASNASGRNSNRSTAAFIAQQDQERLRTMDVTTLNAYVKTPNVRTVTAGAKTFTVTSTVAYANDTNVAATCTSPSSVATYLKISSTVADPTARNAPVVIDSLLSPNASQGSATVQVVGGDGVTGVSGVPVNLDEDSTKNDTTDAAGCVQFGFLGGTDYHVTISKSGYVDKDGNSSLTSQPISVDGGQATLTQFQYAPAGTLQVTYKDNAGTTTVNGRGFSISNAGLAATNQTVSYLTPTSLSSTTPTTSGTASNLFPFGTGYTVWAGGCFAAKPTGTYATNYLTTAILVPPTTYALNLPTPAIPVYVTNSGSALGNARVVVTDVCGAKYPTVLTSNVTGTTKGKVTVYAPFGATSICADNNNGGSTRKVTASVTNDGNLSQQTFAITSSSTSGSC